MTRNLLASVIWFIFCQISVFSQGWVLSNVIKSSDIEPKFSITDDDGNSYIVASFKDTIYNPLIISKGNADLILFKLNIAGNLLWYKQIGGTGLDNAGSLSINNNELLVILNFQNTVKFSSSDSLISKGSFDIGLCKYATETGNYISSVLIGTSNGASDPQVVLNAKIYNSNLVIAGNFNNSIFLGAYPNSDTLVANSFSTNFIAQIDLQGNIIWSKRILSSTSNCKVNKIAVSENGYYFGGFYRGSLYFDVDTLVSFTSGFNDNFLYKTDFNGEGNWVRRIYGAQTENIQAVSTDEFDNVYVLGNYGSPILYVDSTATQVKSYPVNLGNFDTYISKFNRSGILQWLILKGSAGKDIYNDFILRNNVIFATGYFTNQVVFNNDTLNTSGLANSDAFVAAFNQIGDPIAGVSIIGTGDYEDAGIVVNMDANSHAYVSGYYKSQQIKIGSQTYTSTNINKSDLFFAIYQHPFKAVITTERMVSCHGLSDGMLTVTPYFGRPPYTYSWNHDPELNEPVANNLPAGDYTVTITDANSAQTSISKSVTQPQPMAVNGLVTSVSCKNGEDGAIDITVTGGTKAVDYVYNWTTLNGSGVVPLSQDQNGLTDGTYTVLVKDDNNCSATQDFLVTEPARLGYSGVVVTDIIIPPGNNGSVYLTVTGGNTGYTYAWTGPGTYAASTEDIAGLGTAGLYNLHVTDSKSCTSDTSIAVNDGTTLVAQITAKTDVLCFGQDDGTATVTVYNGLPPYSFQWSDQALPTLLADRTGMAPGTYHVVVSDAFTPVPHTAQASVEILSPASGLNLLLNPQDLRCFGDNSGVIDLTVTGGTLPYQYLWNNDYSGEDLVNVASGLYAVTVTDGNNCIEHGSETLDEPSAIALDISVTGEILCYGDKVVSATANASGGFGTFSYLWDDPGTQVTKTAFELGAGTFNVTVTDENGCIKTASTLITQPDSLSLETDVNNPCPGGTNGSIIPTVAGGIPAYDYVWSNDVFERINDGLAAGTYSLTVTDHNNCTIGKEFILTNFDTVKVASVVATDLTCSGSPDGSIAVTASGGSGIYTYSDDGGLTFGPESTFELLPAGEHIVVVQDEKDCISDEYPVTLNKSGTCALLIYDGFSPNNDGLNEVWHIGNIENYPDCSVKIFNTWGTPVFTSNGYGTPWDGKYHGNELPSGTYYYVIDPGDGSGVLTGSVNIVK